VFKRFCDGTVLRNGGLHTGEVQKMLDEWMGDMTYIAAGCRCRCCIPLLIQDDGFWWLFERQLIMTRMSLYCFALLEVLLIEE
jgi:hypothetical protein